MRAWATIGPLLGALAGSVALAGEADVCVTVTREGAGTSRFDVTVRHEDAGRQHDADRRIVVAPAGPLLGERVLLRPHDDA